MESRKIPIKESHLICLGSKCYGTPLLESWPPSSESVKMKNLAIWRPKSLALSKLSSEHQNAKTKTVTSSKIPQKRDTLREREKSRKLAHALEV